MTLDPTLTSSSPSSEAPKADDVAATDTRQDGTPKAERSPLRRFGDDLIYLLVGFPLATASFTAVVTVLSLAASLLVMWVGFPLLVLSLLLARGFAVLERGRLRLRGEVLPVVRYRPRPSGAGWFKTWFDRLRDPQAWLEVLHALVAFPLSMVTWCIAVIWTSTTVGGLTYGIWEPFRPAETPDNKTLAELLDIGLNDLAIYTILGLVGLVTIGPVLRGCAAVQAGLARTLLANEHVAGLQERVFTMRASQDAAADVEIDERRRIERDIHDGPQQRLVRLGMDLATVERRLADDPEEARRLLIEARGHNDAALEELRLLSRGIAPPLLADRGLVAALTDVAARSTVVVDLDVALAAGERLPGRIESAVYFTVAEALTNVAKHAGARSVRVSVRRTTGPGGIVAAEITDDGIGGADPAKGHGLAGLRDRLAALDGTLRIASPSGGPTTLTAELPCAS